MITAENTEKLSKNLPSVLGSRRPFFQAIFLSMASFVAGWICFACFVDPDTGPVDGAEFVLVTTWCAFTLVKMWHQLAPSAAPAACAHPNCK